MPISLKVHTWTPQVLAVYVHKRNGKSGADFIATVDSSCHETATQIHLNEMEMRSEEARIAGGVPYRRRASKNNKNGFTSKPKVQNPAACFCVTENNGDLLAYEMEYQKAMRISDCAEAARLRVAEEAGQQADQEEEEADQRAADETFQAELQMHEANAQANRQVAEETQATHDGMLFSNFINDGDIHQSSSANSLFEASLIC
jgi:hypothetical protein